MPRISLRRASEPVYRQVLPQAFRFAWREKRFWPLAFFASLLLTSGVYDVILNAVRSIHEQCLLLGWSTPIYAQIGGALGAALSDPANYLGISAAFQAVIMITLLLVTLAVLSCVSQAGLVFAVGATRRGSAVSLSRAFRIGGLAFWPVAALNALALAALWIFRFLTAFPLYLALQDTTPGRWLFYLISFSIFVFLSFAVTIIQIFALNAMIAQGASLSSAIIRGYVVLKKHWVTAVETAILLFLIAMGVGILTLGILTIIILPLMAAAVSAAILQSAILLYGTLGIGLVLLLAVVFVATSFMTQLQYATWTLLYRKIGEGGVLPKLHRWARYLSGHYSVPRN